MSTLKWNRLTPLSRGTKSQIISLGPLTTSNFLNMSVVSIIWSRSDFFGLFFFPPLLMFNMCAICSMDHTKSNIFTLMRFSGRLWLCCLSRSCHKLLVVSDFFCQVSALEQKFAFHFCCSLGTKLDPVLSDSERAQDQQGAPHFVHGWSLFSDLFYLHVLQWKCACA